ncbi:PepSY domain-containing protein [Novosphingobium profundi]|uniref:PepSY-associated TM helix domain-containing protein n=1 Tax=Novosphingobium profundi TaxID=1774954 RepID=UPI001BDA5C3F|nr:PepSY-associated TM helix domain-containing protein [Novosphingobium profundi]MBT0669254.1 PepSY domain-containing protein [Novosphingobium profundi]
MKQGLRQSMAWLHTWSGLALGWLLFAMFATGTVSYFQDEITLWMQPEVRAGSDPERAAQGAIDYLSKVAPDARSWYIGLPGPRGATTEVFWQPGEGAPPRARAETQALLDAAGHPLAVRETQGGRFLYRFHFDLYALPVIWARYLVGIAAMAMLVAILSGVITHKKIFTDFFTLRLGKGQRSWLDAHNVSAVLALPFHAMITFTGLVTLASLYMPFGILANYPQTSAFFEAVNGPDKTVARSGEALPVPAIAPLMEHARQRWDGKAVGVVRITNPGDATATISLRRAAHAAIGTAGETLVLAARDGALLGASKAKGPGLTTQSVMVGLHAGRFADLALRWIYFLFGLTGTAMVGTGLVLWTVKRRQRLADPARPHFGFRLVERLNVAAVVGVPAAIAAYFLANRLLPVDLPGHAEAEIHAFFLAWAATLAWAILRPAARIWIEPLAATGTAYLLLPLVNALTSERGLPASLAHGDLLFAGFDLVLLATGLGLLLAARTLHRRARAARTTPSRALPHRHARST